MPEDIRERVVNEILTTHTISDSTTNILDKGFSEFKDKVIVPEFNNFLKETLKKPLDSWTGYKLQGWVTGTKSDYSLNLHNHKGSQVSAVFYLLCDKVDSGGIITFTDPRSNANRGYDPSFAPWFDHLSLQPKSGDIVIFPSFLYHFVTTYQGFIRMAVPVDLFLYADT
jgi:hypothetical protein